MLSFDHLNIFVNKYFQILVEKRAFPLSVGRLFSLKILPIMKLGKALSLPWKWYWNWKFWLYVTEKCYFLKFMWKYFTFNRSYPLKANKEIFPDCLRIYIILSPDHLKTFRKRTYSNFSRKKGVPPFPKDFHQNLLYFPWKCWQYWNLEKLWVYTENGTKTEKFRHQFTEMR